MRDGAGIIYGSAAIGGAVNVILKKHYSGLTVNVGGQSATRSPGTADRLSADFIAGASNDKTRSSSRAASTTSAPLCRCPPEFAIADNRRFGGTNGGSPAFAGNVQSVASGALPVVLKPGFSSSATPTSAADYISIDQNTFSSNQLFNFRQYSPRLPARSAIRCISISTTRSPAKRWSSTAASSTPSCARSTASRRRRSSCLPTAWAGRTAPWPTGVPITSSSVPMPCWKRGRLHPLPLGRARQPRE